jgi:hypothetical protein
MSQERNEPMQRNRNARCAVRAIACLIALASSVPPVPALASGNGAQSGEPAPPELQRVRSKRWWLDFWCHSMQEQAFVEWMHQSTGSIAWMHVMTVPQVNALYAWWLKEIWFGTGEGAPPP